MPDAPEFTRGHLIDASQLIRRFLADRFPKVKIVPELDPNASINVPLLLVDVYGDDNPSTSNGPGMWDVTVDLYLIARSASQLRELEVAIDQEVMSWDFPGQGFVQDVGGVSRAERAAMFDETPDVIVIGKDFLQSEATYALRMRSLL